MKRKHFFCSNECSILYRKEHSIIYHKKCLNCQKEFSCKDNSKKFCSCKCSGLYNNKYRSYIITEDIKKSISIKLLNFNIKKYNKNPKYCQFCGKKISYKDRYKKTCSTKCCNNLITQKLKNYGGIRQHSGRGKKGWYKGYYCDSSWELAYVIYNINHNIKFERCHNYIKYNYKNQIYKYYPDFLLENGTFVEIKGYESEQWIAKKKNFLKIII